jgi:hypothetical protein
MLSRPVNIAALVSAAALLASAAPALAAPPPNDAFAAATTVSATETTGATLPGQTLDGSTVEAGEIGVSGGQSVWYRFMPGYSGTAYVDACDADFHPIVHTYTGAGLGALTFTAMPLPTSCNAKSVAGDMTAFAVTAGQEVRIQVSSYQPSLSGTHFTLRLNTPHNDGLAAPDGISGSIYGAFALLMGATKEAGEPSHAGDVGGHSVWFNWTSGSAGPAKFSTCSFQTGFDTLLGVYTGNAYPLTSVASNDDDPTCDQNIRASTAKFTAAAHTTYKVAVDAFHTVTPAQLAGLTLVLFPPVEDQLADATPISGTIATGSWGYMATKEPGEPNHAGSPGGASVWWAYTATQSGPLTFDTCAQYPEAPDTLLAVYTGSSYPLTPVASSDDTTECGLGKSSLVTFDAIAGTTYRIAVDAKGGQGDVQMLNAGVPANDWFAHPRALSGSGTVDVDTGPFSAQPGEPAHAGAPATFSSWWTYTAPSDGTVHFDTCADYVDTVLAVYTGTALDALTPVASNDDTSGCGALDVGASVDFAATAGTTYRIALDDKMYGNRIHLAYGGPGAPAPAPVAGSSDQPRGGADPGPLVGTVKLGRARLRRLINGKFAVTVGCRRACGLEAILRSHGRRIAAGVTTTRSAGTAKVRLRVPLRRKAALRRLRRLNTSLRLTAIDPATHAAARMARQVRFRR